MNKEQRVIVARLAKEFEDKLRDELASSLAPNEHLKIEVTCDAEVVMLEPLEVKVSLLTTEIGRYRWPKHQRMRILRAAKTSEVAKLLDIVKTDRHRRIVESFVKSSNAPTPVANLSLKPWNLEPLNTMLRQEGWAIALRDLLGDHKYQFYILVPPSS